MQRRTINARANGPVFKLPAAVAALVAMACAVAVPQNAPLLAQVPVFAQVDEQHERPARPRRAGRRQAATLNGLTIASWNLKDAVAAGAIVHEIRKPDVWRNTFVRHNRVSRSKSKLNNTIAGADIILLQGVSSIRQARKLFPASRWKLIVSRQILKHARRQGRFPREMPQGFVTTAIAIRYQLGLRVTGQQHLLELARPAPAPASGQQTQDDPPAVSQSQNPPTPPATAPSTGTTSTAASQSSPTGSGHAMKRAQQAGLAVRVFVDRRPIWLVSVAFAGKCLRERRCSARDALDEWIEDKRDFDIPVITGGRLYHPGARRSKTASGTNATAASHDDQPEADQPSCAEQDIVLDTRINGNVERITNAGCIALATLTE